MPTANPLEQLRRRMLSHATPAAFAALAEEHRRAGRLDEAIAVCRDGLARYPAYVSARVTLGRALLDSGDVAAAVAELEQAVAQAPDNLAAVRALDGAHEALAQLPAPPPLPTPVAPAADADVADLADLALQDSPDQEPADAFALSRDDDASLAWVSDAPVPETDVSTPATADPLTAALGVGPDGPQEFGLGPDWLPPPDPAQPASSTAPATAVSGEDYTQALYAHADAPTMFFRPPHPQGDEPAGIWPVPVAPDDTLTDPVAGAAVMPWHPEPELEAAAPPAAATADAPGLDDWGCPPPDVPVPVAAADGSDASADASADPGGNGFWGGLFVEPVSEGAAPAVFAGWDAPGPSAPEPPSWASSEDPATPDEAAADSAASASEGSEPYTLRDWEGPAPQLGAFAIRDDVVSPDAQADAWSVVAEATAAADGQTMSEVDHSPTFPESPALETALADEKSAAHAVSSVVSSDPSDQLQAPWAGSVASALDEVFARAGQPVTPEPPAHPNPAVRHALADAAVEAVIEDIADREDTMPPALASLQQMLDAVRARRAALAARATDIH